MSDNLGKYQELFNTELTNRTANADKYRWGLSVKTKKQRKYRMLSVQSRSIDALLDHTVEHLNSGNCVTAMTPDLIINFYKD